MHLKRTLSLLVVTSFFCSNLPTGFAQTAVPFPDTQDTWFRYRDAISGLQERGIIGGYPDGTFRPDAPINRAELLKIVFKGHTLTAANRRCFSDINPDAWYAPYVCTAERRGIIDGYPDGTYKPEQTVNFAEAIKIILRAYGREITEEGGANWFAPYVKELDDNDILPKHAYIPWDTLTRARAADLIWRVIRYDEEGIVFRFSPGCGRAPPSQIAMSLQVEGQERKFLTTIPESYIYHDPIPLVVAFHGRTNSNEEVRAYYKLDSNIRDAVIVYPAALSNGNGSYSWADAGDGATQLRDIAFFDALVSFISEKYCIDMDQLFVVGHSLGAWFSNSVACVRGDVIRASATVGGDSIMTNCAGPSAAMIIHNPSDTLAPFSGSVRNREQRVKENACSWETVPVEPQAFKCVSHGECADNPVLFCPHENDIDGRGQYYPHNWPRDTGKFIADFFQSL